jgi:hypothetical protein
MCQSGIELHGLMLAVEQLSGREASLRNDIEAWADYLQEREVPEAAAELRKAAAALQEVANNLAEVSHQLDHLHDHGHDHSHITATHFE